MNKLFKKAKSGKFITWQIFVKENSFCTIEGFEDGKLTQSDPTVCLGKNIGKSNETTPEQQALLEAKAKYEKKLKEGYSPTKEDSFLFEPMLAKNYQDYLKDIPDWVYVQPKIDGIRSNLINGVHISRKGNAFVSVPHLNFPFEGILDGELYNHDLKEDFEKIVSLVKKTKPTQEDLEESAKVIKYYVYDIVSEYNFEVRTNLVRAICENNPNFVYLPTYYIPKTLIGEYHKSFLEQGYEGTMVRIGGQPYINGRTKYLLKYKDFIDDEFTILDIIEGKGNRSGKAGNLVIQVSPDITCDVSMTGSEEFMEKVLLDKTQIIGKQATVKFFGYTKKGKLRFPTLKTIRDYE